MFEFLRKLFSSVIAILDFITKYSKAIVLLTIIYVVFFNSDKERITTKGTANLQKIELASLIIGVSKTLENIEKAKTDTNIKSVLLVVDSPGGVVAPSAEVAYAIKELKQIKPVVAYASRVMASGSYYASTWADKIIASLGSMVGSIGVITQGVNTKELMDKIGIQTQTVKAGKYKESGTPTRKWTEFEEKQLQNAIDDTYNMLITDVVTVRNLDTKNYISSADAKILTSKQTKNVGLVGEVVNTTVAQKVLAKLSKVENPVWKKEDKFEKLIDKLVSEVVSQISMNFITGLKVY